MTSIYKITNTVNNKIYIGKTMCSLDKRFQEHKRSALQSRSKTRPLYSAMNKYGIDKFTITLVEITNNPEEREIFWIDFYKSYGSSGYNATKGGDGRPYVDYDMVEKVYIETGYDLGKTIKLVDHDRATIKRVLKSRGYELKTLMKSGKECHNVKITEEQVREARRLYKDGVGYRKIAEMLQISVDTSRDVVYNRSWKYLI